MPHDPFPCPEPARSAAVSEHRLFTGHIFLREDQGRVAQTDFTLDVGGGTVTIIYSDGVPHVVTDPAAVAFFNGRLIPSLQSALP